MPHKETHAVRVHADPSQYREHTTPIYQTSSYMFDSAEHGQELFADQVEGNIYSRFSNPNTSELVAKLAVLEGMEEGFAFASGMSAIFSSIAAFLDQGDHLVASRALFGSTFQILTRILPRWGIQCSFVDGNDRDEWEKAIQPHTKMLFLETPSNPGLAIYDLEMIGEIKREHGLLLNVDNSFATPVIQNPVEYGADLIVHSTTKFIDGQGRTIGGAAVCTPDAIGPLRFFARHSGPCMAPFNAWLLSKSIETLPVRMRAHCENAMDLASRLDGHPELEFVRYPFLPGHPQYELAKKQMKMGGALLTIEVKGGLERARKFINSLEVLTLSANLGDTRTIVTHPATTTHSKLSEEERLQVGITPGLLRIAVGLEHVDDIFLDISRALDKSK